MKKKKSFLIMYYLSRILFLYNRVYREQNMKGFSLRISTDKNNIITSKTMTYYLD